MTDALDTAAAGLPYFMFGMILGFLLACLAFAIAWDRLGAGRGDEKSTTHQKIEP